MATTNRNAVEKLQESFFNCDFNTWVVVLEKSLSSYSDILNSSQNLEISQIELETSNSVCDIRSRIRGISKRFSDITNSIVISNWITDISNSNHLVTSLIQFVKSQREIEIYLIRPMISLIHAGLLISQIQFVISQIELETSINQFVISQTELDISLN